MLFVSRDDYMLSTKGDRIMKQMEELISDEAADPAKFSVPAHTSTDQFADEVTLLFIYFMQ